MKENGKDKSEERNVSRPGNNNEDNSAGNVNAEEEIVYNSSPTVTTSIFIFWILPVLILALYSRFLVDTETPPRATLSKELKKPLSLKIDPSVVRGASSPDPGAEPPTGGRKKSTTKSKRKQASASKITPSTAPPTKQAHPSDLSSFPPSYHRIVNKIQRNRRSVYQILSTPPKINTESSSKTSSTDLPASKPVSQPSKKILPTPTQPSKKKKESSAAPANSRGGVYGASSDPVRIKMNEDIDTYREEYQSDMNDEFKAIALADALRRYDINYHDGGTKQPEALKMYEKAIYLTLQKKKKKISDGVATDINKSSSIGSGNIPMEILIDYNLKSVDGLLCALYAAKGKVWFMSNMFEKAVEEYTNCLQIEPLYLDALSSRGSTLIILGKYEQAASDFMKTIENDAQSMFTDAYTGLVKLLSSNENIIPGGWEIAVRKLEEIIPRFEQMHTTNVGETKNGIALTLNRLHHAMFTYHDSKTKDISEAWYHLQLSFKHKLSALPKWTLGFEAKKVQQTKQIFTKGFWPDAMGSKSRVPVFIVGFVRSGSTLLERVLDSHPHIVGTGEDSVFNGRLDHIRNKIVEGSMTGDQSLLVDIVADLAEDVVDEMADRWKTIDSNTENETENEIDSIRKDPRRFVDKMLTNYYNIGFIHMLFPDALILHVIREPMDTCFSAFKHEFPSGTLDYTSDFTSLAELYHAYRDLMDHWDKQLPGRVTHVKYEDMVHDMPGVAKALIDATGLKWDDDVLNFHKKKHAVNTLSTTQVRKGVYKHSLQAWKKYEDELQPLVKLLGKRVDAPFATSLKGYKKEH